MAFGDRGGFRGGRGGGRGGDRGGRGGRGCVHYPLCYALSTCSVARDVMFEHTAQRRPTASQLDMYTMKSFAYQQQFNVAVCSSPRPIFRHMSST